MSAPNRPDKRVLVRWSDDLDKTVLLAIQYACTEAGIKIPWTRVAEIMGDKFTEGSIVQHLAKLRAKMVDCDMQVPPPLKRGMVTKEPSRIYAVTGPSTKRKRALATAVRKAPLPLPDEAAMSPTPARRVAKPKPSKKRRAMSDEDEEDDDDPMPDLFDNDTESDEDFGAKKRKANKNPRRATARPTAQKVVKGKALAPIKSDVAIHDVVAEHETRADGPAAHTRRLKKDYAIMDAPDSDDDTESAEELEDEPEGENSEVTDQSQEDSDQSTMPESEQADATPARTPAQKSKKVLLHTMPNVSANAVANDAPTFHNEPDFHDQDVLESYAAPRTMPAAHRTSSVHHAPIHNRYSAGSNMNFDAVRTSQALPALPSRMVNAFGGRVHHFNHPYSNQFAMPAPALLSSNRSRTNETDLESVRPHSAGVVHTSNNSSEDEIPESTFRLEDLDHLATNFTFAGDMIGDVDTGDDLTQLNFDDGAGNLNWAWN